MKHISTQFYNSDQSWHYEFIGAIDKWRLRVYIRRNAYDHQSYVRGYVLDPERLCWNLLVDRPIEGAACEGASYTQKTKTTPAKFQEDAVSVLEELIALVIPPSVPKRQKYVGTL